MKTMSKTYYLALIKRADDAGVYEMLLKAWLNKWDTIEEFILNGLTHKNIESLAELTKKEIKK